MWCRNRTNGVVGIFPSRLNIPRSATLRLNFNAIGSDDFLSLSVTCESHGFSCFLHFRRTDGLMNDATGTLKIDSSWSLLETWVFPHFWFYSVRFYEWICIKEKIEIEIVLVFNFLRRKTSKCRKTVRKQTSWRKYTRVFRIPVRLRQIHESTLIRNGFMFTVGVWIYTSLFY